MTKIIEGNIVFPSNVHYGQIIVENEHIIDVRIDKSNFSKPDFMVEENKYIAPGFIDIQINGGFGKDFKTDEDALETVSNNIFRFGTTSFCATIPTSKLDVFYNHSRKLVDNYQQGDQAKFLGFHLEGPVLNPEKAGAHNPEELKMPFEIDLDKYINEHVRIITLSPELIGAKEFIKAILKKSIKVGIGHSNISYENFVEILDEDNMFIVHLFNAMPSLNAREPGLVGAAFENDNLYTSIIADGIHLHPITIKAFWKSRHNKSRIICISDASPVTGLEEGTYNYGDRIISKLNDRAVLDNGKMVGSIYTLVDAIRNLIFSCKCSFSDAVNTISLNPATFLGLQNKIGQIKIGNQADLVILDSNIEVEKTFINGQLMYDNKMSL